MCKAKSRVEVVEDFESRPHKAVTSLVERDKAMPELRELKMPKAVPGYTGGECPKAARQKEEKKRRRRKRKCDGWSRR